LGFARAAKVLAVYYGCNAFIWVARVAAWLILVVMVIYGLISLDFAFKQNWSMAIVWGGYCVSNWGLYLISMKG
jgi:hypothetical protein